jgi:hypothetical protein
MLKLTAAAMLTMLASGAHAATWYVSTSGADTSPGTRSQPFKTWQKAIDRAVAGDEILIEPGTYHVSAKRGYGARLTRSGNASAPIVLRGDGGRPVLNCKNLQSSWGMYCLDVQASWWRIEDIAVTGAVQLQRDSWVVGINLENASNNVLSRVESYRNQGPGILIAGRSASNLLLNSDSHHNYDSRSSPAGGNADGIQLANLTADADGNRIAGCRSWANSDDGFDLWNSETRVEFEGSWAFRNGFVPDTLKPAGNGSGFKLGRNDSGPMHRVVNSLAFANRSIGFDSNDAGGALDIANNTAYANGSASY